MAESAVVPAPAPALAKVAAPTLRTMLPSIRICALVYGLMFLVWRVGGFQFFELQVYDHFLRAQPRGSAEASPVVVIAITEADVQRLQAYPLTDRVLAEVLEKLMVHGPAAVVVDLYRDLTVFDAKTAGEQPEDIKTAPEKPPELPPLAAAFRRHPNILAIQRLGLAGEPEVLAPPFLADNHDQLGFNDFPTDLKVDENARRVLLIMDDGQRNYFNVSLLAAMLYLDTRGIALVRDPANPERWRLGKAEYVPFEPNDGAYIRADARGYQVLLDFRGPEDFDTFTLSEVIDQTIPAAALRGRVVILGQMLNSYKDFLSTPFTRRFPGVHMHAHVVDQVVRSALKGERPMRSWREWQEALWLLAWCAAGTLTGATLRSPSASVFIVAFGLAGLFAICWLALMSGLWLLMIAPAVTFTAASALSIAHQAYAEKRRRDDLMQLFSRHVSANIAADIWEHRDQFMEGHRPKAQILTGTVFFSDLKGFTGMAEALPPDELMAWLNEYMEIMAGLIEGHGGMVNKYMGDAIMAVFGAPIPRSTEEEIRQDAINAVRCALAMGEQLDQLNDAWGQRGLPTTTMRIGIATGPLVSGSIGGSKRLEYTVTGDTVVIAKRLESAEKDSRQLEKASLSCRILIAEQTATMLGSSCKFREVGPMLLEGKHRQVGVFVVTGDNRGVQS